MNAPAAPPLVRLAGVSVLADAGMSTERAVLAAIDLEIRAGETIGLVGRSGAGKTTLASVVAGLLAPTAGEVEHAGRTLRFDDGAFLGDVGLAFQEPERGFFEETLLDDVSFGARNRGLSRAAAAGRAGEALAEVGLSPEEFGARFPETLSGGEARRAALAGILAFEPRLVVLDEPTTALDANGLDRLRAMLGALRDRGQAYLIASHDVALLGEECARILVLHEGSLRWDGPSSRLGEGLPASWSEDVGEGEKLWAVARAMRARGLIGEDEAPTPESLARAWPAGNRPGAPF